MMEEMADEEKVSFELFKYIIWAGSHFFAAFLGMPGIGLAVRIL